MLKTSIALFFAVMVTGSPAFAQEAPDLADLVGARGAGGETQLEARGYQFVTVNTVRDTKWSFWTNGRTGQCVQVATADGRYTAINRVPQANCHPAGRPSEDAYAPPPQPDYGRPGTQALTLICYGSGSGPAAETYSGYRYNGRSKRFEPEFGTALGREGFSSDVQVEIFDGRGRIHLGGKLVSPIHSGGSDGWWPLEEVMVTPDRITGRYRLNGLNKPRVEIERRTRIIRIKAATAFTGRCDVGDWRSGF
jgi:hypothetical protein